MTAVIKSMLKRALAIAPFFILFTAAGQSVPQGPDIDLSAQGQFFALSVKSLDETSQWYQRNLGFKVSKRMIAKDSSSMTEILKSGNIVIEIVQQKKSISKDEVKRQPDFLWHGIFRFFMVRDNAKNIIQFFETMR
jgi:hypothetical protein